MSDEFMSELRYVPHPGEYIKDAIEELGITQNEFAIRIGTTGKTISKIINGDSNITFDIASKLSAFFGTSDNLWMNLQYSYNQYLKDLELEKEENEEIKILSYFDKAYLKNILNIEVTKNNKKEVIKQLKQLFMVNALRCLNSPDLFAFCRTSVLKDIDEKQLILRNAWISYAMYISRNIECKEYNEDKLFQVLPEVRNLIKESPDIFIPKLKEYLSDAGIKFIILPYLKGSNVSAVTKWIPNENAIMIAINDHGKDADKIWFNIYHEIGHAVKNKKRYLTISLEKDKIIDDDETFANNFAKDQLVNPKQYKKFIEKKDFSITAIKDFSNEIELPIFMVIGRLQKDGYLNWNDLNEYKVKYNIRLK